MSSSVCGGGRFCTFHQAMNMAETDAVHRHCGFSKGYQVSVFDSWMVRFPCLKRSRTCNPGRTCEDSESERNHGVSQWITPSFMTEWCRQIKKTKKNTPKQAIQRGFRRLFMAAGTHLGFHLTGVDPALLSIPRLACPPPSSFTPAEYLKLLQWPQRPMDVAGGVSEFPTQCFFLAESR